MIKIGKDIQVELSEYKGKKYVSIRKYYKDDSGELKPGKARISMPLEVWKEFTEKFDDIKKDIEKDNK